MAAGGVASAEYSLSAVMMIVSRLVPDRSGATAGASRSSVNNILMPESRTRCSTSGAA